MNSSYVLGQDDEWGQRYYFTYYSEFGASRGAASVIEVIILSMIFVISVIANLELAACILRYKEMRTSTNLCLVNLAAADLLFALGVPAIAHTRLTQSWKLGDAVCKLLPYSQFVCGFVLLWTLTLISMDRYRCLAVAPYRSALTIPRVLLTSLAMWIVAALVFSPVIVWFRLKVIRDDLSTCTLIFPKSDVVDVSLCFTVPIIIIACLLPMGLLVYHYQRVFRSILNTRNRWAVPCVLQEQKKSSRRGSELSVVASLVPWATRKMSSVSMTRHQGRTGSLSQHEEVRLNKHLRVVRILFLNVVAVLFMWLPITTVLLLIHLDSRRPTDDTNFFLKSSHFIWALVVAQLNTVVNPLLYGIFSENIRTRIKFWWKRDVETGVSERESGRTSSKRVIKSLETLHDRLGVARPFKASSKPTKKNSSCSIVGSIIEIPSSEQT